MKDNTAVWETVFHHRSKDAFYIVDRSGAALVATENATIDVEDWSTLYWKQLAPAQRDFLLAGVLDGEQIADFPPMEQTVTGPFQPRFRVFEKAIYIGAPLQISGAYTKAEPTSFESAGLYDFLAKNRAADGELKNIRSVLIAHLGGGVTVREARNESILGAELAVASQGSRAVMPVQSFGKLSAELNITDLYEAERVPQPTSDAPLFKLVGAVAVIAGLLIGIPALNAELAKPGPVSAAYASLREMIGVPVEAPAPKLKIARRPKAALNESTQASVVSTPKPTPLPSQIGAQTLSPAQIEKWNIPAGASRWPVVGENFVAVLRPPNLKAESLLPYSPLPRAKAPALLQNRFIGLSEVADANGYVPLAVWDLETNHVIGRIFEKGLIGAALLSSDQVVTLSQLPLQPLNLRVWDLKTAKSISEFVFPPGVLGPFVLGQDRAVVLIGQTAPGTTEPRYNGYMWEQKNPELTRFDLDIPNPDLALAPSGKWIAIGSGSRVVALETATQQAQLVTIPSSSAAAKYNLIGFASDDRLMIQEGSNIFAASGFGAKIQVEMMPPLNGEVIALTSDSSAGLIRLSDKSGLSLRPLLDPAKTKSVCKSDCYNSLQLSSVGVSPDGRWLSANVKGTHSEMTFRDTGSADVYAPDYDISSRLAAYVGVPPSASLEDCLTYAGGCFKTGMTALDNKEYGRAYAYLYGACRGGQFNACTEIARSATVLKLTPEQADSFAEFGCRFGNPSSCTLRAAVPAAPVMPAATPAK